MKNINLIRKQFSSENTYHYTIDYDKLAVICGEQLEKKEEKTAISDECAHGQNDQHEVVKMTTAILKENNKENNYIYNNSSSHKFSLLQKNKTFRRSEEEGLSAKIPNYTEVKDFIQKYQQENPNLSFLGGDQFYSMCKLCKYLNMMLVTDCLEIRPNIDLETFLQLLTCLSDRMFNLSISLILWRFLSLSTSSMK